MPTNQNRPSSETSRGLTRFGTLGYSPMKDLSSRLFPQGAVAQLGERMTGSHEVRGSIPLGSTNCINY